MSSRLIPLRYAATCAGCGTALSARTRAWWESSTKTVRCECCGPEDAAPIDRNTAGASAQREFDRRRTNREERVRADHPILGDALLALNGDPQSTRAWARGAEGERRVAAELDALPGVVALHDRRIPRSRANIDHIAVGPNGVWVIDAKRYKGGEVRRRGSSLYVGRRDCTQRVLAMDTQVDAVRKALGTEWEHVPVTAALAFVDAEWPWFAKPFVLRGVHIAGPGGTAAAVRAAGPYTDAGIERIARRLDAVLKAA